MSSGCSHKLSNNIRLLTIILNKYFYKGILYCNINFCKMLKTLLPWVLKSNSVSCSESFV